MTTQDLAVSEKGTREDAKQMLHSPSPAHSTRQYHTVSSQPQTPARATSSIISPFRMDLHYGARMGESTAYVSGAATGTGTVDVVTRDAAAQALGTVLQLHFDKTVEKKRAADAQKQELWRLFLAFFLFLALVLSAVAGSPPARLQCRHLWAPAGLLSLAHLAFYAAIAHHLRCLNGFRYQRRCHKLTLALAADRLRMLKSGADVVAAADLEVPYQEPPDTYLTKFKRSWAIHFAFLITTFAFSVAATVAILCF